MANDLATLKEKLLAAAIAKAEAGIKSYSIDGRTITYNSPKEMLDAIVSLITSESSSIPRVTYVEVSDV